MTKRSIVRHTLEFVTAQTIQPAEWVIVDDGSTDDTGRIIDEYAKQFSWIQTIHRPNRGFRQPGGGVMEAFNDGYNRLRTKEWEFIVKLDGDLSFLPGLLSKVLRAFCE